LFRAELDVESKDGIISVGVSGASGAASGQVRVFAEDARGRRRELGSGTLASDGGAARVSVAAVPPAGTRRLAVVLRGRDAAGDLIAVVEKTLP